LSATGGAPPWGVAGAEGGDAGCGKGGGGWFTTGDTVIAGGETDPEPVPGEDSEAEPAAGEAGEVGTDEAGSEPGEGAEVGTDRAGSEPTDEPGERLGGGLLLAWVGSATWS
jgi:hypothetical protein